jgi:hypothetical protein
MKRQSRRALACCPVDLSLDARGLILIYLQGLSRNIWLIYGRAVIVTGVIVSTRPANLPSYWRARTEIVPALVVMINTPWY